MVDHKNDISFQTFYITDFFERVLDKARGDLEEHHINIVETLNHFLQSFENHVDGLEALAREEATSELSIFLFDMIERLTEQPSRKLYEGLDDLSTDFLNLFSLMIEDQASVETLQRILDIAPSETEVKTGAESREAADVLSFEEFYQREFQRILDEKLDKQFDSSTGDKYKTLIEFCMPVIQEENRDTLAARTEAPVAAVLYTLFEIFPLEEVIQDSMQKVNTLPDNIDELISKMVYLDSEEKTLLDNIISHGALEVKSEETEMVEQEENASPQNSQENEEPGEPQSIDDMLGQYFQSEVDEHLTVFRKFIQDAREREEHYFPLHDLIKQFKSFKEICMIHGYQPLEYLSSMMIDTLKTAQKNEQRLTAESFELFEELFNKLEDVSNFTGDDEAIIEQLENFVASLKESLQEAPVKPGEPAEAAVTAEKPEREEEKAEKEKTEEAEIEEEEVEQQISFKDRARMAEALKEVMEGMARKVWNRHETFDRASDRAYISRVLENLAASVTLFETKLKTDFIDPLTEAYQAAEKFEDQEQREALLAKIKSVWEKGLGRIETPLDISDLQSEFEAIRAMEDVEREEIFGLQDDQKIAGALSETLRAVWDQTQPLLEPALISGDTKAEITLVARLKNIGNTLQLAEYNDCLKAISTFRNMMREQKTYLQSTTQLDELDSAFRLIIERLAAKGKNAEYNDIIQVLDDLFEEAVKEEAPPESEAAGEEDMESAFLRETGNYLEQIREALQKVQENPEDAASFSTIEHAVHSIRTSAYLMEKEQIGDLAAQIEDIAEFFSNSPQSADNSVLNDLTPGVEAIAALTRNEDVDVGAAHHALKRILNRIMSEDEAAREPAKKEDAETEQAAEDQDEELLEIFRKEAMEYVTILKEFQKALASEDGDISQYNNYSYAAHSLKSAAKMLGFNQISTLTDGLEKLIEAMKIGKIDAEPSLAKTVAEALDLIQTLSEGQTVNPSQIAQITQALSPEKWEKSFESEESYEQQTPEQRERVKHIFVDEANRLINAIYDELIQLENMPESDTLLSRIVRNLHTLKGSAMMVEYEKIGHLSHKLEDYFYIYKRQSLEHKEEMLDPAFSAMELMQQLLETIQAKNREDVPSYTGKLAELDNKLFLYQNYEPGLETAAAPQKGRKAEFSETSAVPDEENVIKISTDYLDKLINMATELAIHRTELSGQLEHLKSIIQTFDHAKKQEHEAEALLEELLRSREKIDENLPAQQKGKNVNQLNDLLQNVFNEIDRVTKNVNRLYYGFEEQVGRIANVSKALHTDILNVRMVPVDHLFQRFPRAVHDLARKQGKKVKLDIESGGAEMDRAMIEALADPLLHILRNAVDHGLELPDVRKENDKDEKGQILLKAWQDKNQIVIQVSDDGSGIDVEAVKETVSHRNLADADKLESMEEGEIFDFIFYPEFSTRKETDELSGRGIGMDVVYNQIQRLKGNIRVQSRKNEGTTFIIRLPLTLVVTQALMVTSQDQTIAIPTVAVQESLTIKDDDLLMDDDRQYVQVRGNLLPYIEIDHLLQFKKSESQQPSSKKALIIHDADISVALGVEQIIGRQEIVVKALGSRLQNVPYVSGGTIMASGQVAMILDYSAVIHAVEKKFFKPGKERKKYRPPRIPKAEEQEQEIPESRSVEIPLKTVSERKPVIMIVDDSNSVRNFVGSVLERNGFATVKASSGEEAVKKVNEHEIDLMITDLEMPGMHGFNLISQIREDSELNALPIVILTGRSGQGQKEEGERLGANAFISKPFKEVDLLKVIKQFIRTA